MRSILAVDDLSFNLRWSPRRKTIQITVERDAELVVTAPEGCELTAIEEFIREKRFWLYTRLAEKQALRRSVAPKEFVTGEGFPYLGRSYRLLLVDDQDVPLALKEGRFRLLRSEVDSARGQFIRWYTDHAGPWLDRGVRRLTPQMGLAPVSVRVRDLGFRWGSATQRGSLNFHWATILLPPRVVDYVVVHELTHLFEPRHSSEFWKRVERALPDYEARKQWLAEHGMAFASI